MTRRERRAREEAAQSRSAQPARLGSSSVSAAPLQPNPMAVAPRKPKPLLRVGPPRGASHPPAPALPRGESAPRPRSRRLRRQLLSKLMTLGAMIGAGLMMVATSLPASAFYPVEQPVGTVAASAMPEQPEAAEVQSVRVHVAGERTVSRDNYTAVSLRERLFLEYGSRDWSYTNNPNGTIQWPFAIAVPISSGYGPRIAPCGGCSSFHNGIDFTPGAGAPIQAIADGVVSRVGHLRWGLGEYVVVDHHIDGNLVQSHYGHMQRNSQKVEVGQKVQVGDTLGLVGSTGASTGSHLHLEIHVNGEAVNPFTWLKEYAN